MISPEEASAKKLMKFDSPGPRLAYVVVFALVVVGSILFELFTLPPGPARVLLFVPLLWSYFILAPRGMIIAGAIASILRISVELIGVYKQVRPVGTLDVVLEIVLPVLLYVLLGVAFYRYRVRQFKLLDHIARLRASEARAQAAISLAHDFNNVLTVIIGLGNVLEQDASVSDRFRRNLAQMKEAATRGLQLVAEWMTVQPDHTDEEPTIDLSREIRQQVGVVERVLPAEIQVEYFFCEKPLPVALKSSELHRIFMNLCLNARNAMPHGGRLTVRTRSVHDEKNEYVVLVVSDTGGGIPPNIVNHIFEPFFTTRTVEGGAGLGLSVVQTLVRAHGGWVKVDTFPDQGSTFTIFVPVVRDLVA